jgi:hypothetical protein
MIDTKWIDKFAAQAPSIDDVRDGAARCAEETARWERGERGPLRMPHGLIAGEFSDAEFGTAGEVATKVGNALLARGQRFRPELAWSTAAKLLRGGWQRGHQLLAHVVGGEEPC